MAHTIPSYRVSGTLLAFIVLGLVGTVTFLRQGLLSLGADQEPLAKRGNGFGFDELSDFEPLKTIPWFYNWGPNLSDDLRETAEAAGVEFVPMQWAQWYIEDLASFLPEGARALLGFNEPNHREQANMTPQEAAAYWPQLEKVAKERGMRLGAPAAAPCGDNCVIADPFEWWDGFFAACQDCEIHFLPTHYYSCSPKYLQWYLEGCKRYGLPIWLTEFDCPNEAGPPAVQEAYMRAVLPVLDADPRVERYAWFMPRTDFGWIGPTASLLEEGEASLSPLGDIYTNQHASWGDRQPLKPSAGGEPDLGRKYELDRLFDLRASLQGGAQMDELHTGVLSAFSEGSASISASTMHSLSAGIALLEEETSREAPQGVSARHSEGHRRATPALPDSRRRLAERDGASSLGAIWLKVCSKVCTSPEVAAALKQGTAQQLLIEHCRDCGFTFRQSQSSSIHFNGSRLHSHKG